MPNRCPEEFDEDMASPLRDLSSVSARPPNDALFTYADIDIDNLSETLGIPWEVSKSIPFGSVVPYLSFVWDLDARTVAIPEEKKIKYLNVIEEWKKKPTHALAEVQGLYAWKPCFQDSITVLSCHIPHPATYPTPQHAR